MIIAFDVVDTLIIPAAATGSDDYVPNYETIAVYRWFQQQGHTMIVWSSDGEDYARHGPYPSTHQLGHKASWRC